MCNSVNRYGLSRDIPDDIRRRVRQACRGGCAICGSPIGQYEHIDPEFRDAREHKPEGITYLCGGCHEKVTRGHIDKQTVERARRDPWLTRHDRPKYPYAFNITSSAPSIWVGPGRVIGYATIIEVDRVPLLSLEPPEFEDGPFLVSARFSDEDGELIFAIEKNELLLNKKSWDIEVKGATFIVRRGLADIIAKITTLPPDTVILEKLRAYAGIFPIEIDSTKVSLRHGCSGPFEFKVSAGAADTLPPALLVCSSAEPHEMRMDGRGGTVSLGALSAMRPKNS